MASKWEQILREDDRIICQRSMERYIKLMDSYIDDTHIIGNQKHHLLPKSLHNEYESLRRHQWNSITIRPKVHYLAHWLLSKMYKGKMLTAFVMMNKEVGGVQTTGALYEIGRQIAIDSGVMNQNSGRKWATNGTEDIFLKQGDELPTNYNYGRVNGNTSTGKKWVTNGIDDMYLSMGDEIPKGFSVGRTGAGPKGKIGIHNKNTETIKAFYYIHKMDIQDYLDQGWSLGLGCGRRPKRSPDVLRWYHNQEQGKNWRGPSGEQPEGYVKGRLKWKK